MAFKGTKIIKRINEYYDSVPIVGDMILHKINECFDDDDGALVLSSELVRTDEIYGKLYRITILTTEGKVQEQAIMQPDYSAPSCCSLELLRGIE